jgi:adenosylhomocysteine nucleosidase
MDGARSILVLAPMRSELRPVVRQLRATAAHVPGATVAYRASLDPASVTAALIGVGPAAARQATERLLDAGSYDHVVVSGIAGGIGPEAEIGALITPAEVEDLSTGTRFEPVTPAGHVPKGAIATTADLITDDGAVAALVERGIVGLDMETSAVADVCQQRGVPWSVFRVVSDRPQDGLLEPGVFEILERDGSVNLGRAARYIARNPMRIGALARLGRDSSAAARRAAREAVAACASL